VCTSRCHAEPPSADVYDVKAAQKACGGGKPIVVPFFYPTQKDNDWDSKVDARLLRLIPRYDSTKPLCNGLHMILIAPRARLDIFQKAIRMWKTALQRYWKALLANIVPYDRKNAAGRIWIAIIHPEQQLSLCADPRRTLLMSEHDTESILTTVRTQPSIFTNTPYNPSHIDPTSPLRAGLDPSVVVILVGPVMGHPELAGMQMGVVEIRLGFTIDGDSEQTLFTEEKFGLHGIGGGLITISAAIATGVTEMSNPIVKTRDLERSITRLYKCSVLEPKHASALRFIANPRIPRGFAHRQLNQLFTRIGDGTLHTVGPFASFRPVAALLPEDNIAMSVYIWQGNHPDNEILIGSRSCVVARSASRTPSMITSNAICTATRAAC
jgi:hypothetical protein